jgi:hypothetical protein
VHKTSVHEQTSNLNALFVILLLQRKTNQKHTYHQFMKERNHLNESFKAHVISVLNALFVILLLQRKTNQKHTYHQFMKERNHLNESLKAHVISVHEGKKPLQCNTCGASLKKCQLESA